jgi:hypothetical protein
VFDELLGLGLKWEVIESRFEREDSTVVAVKTVNTNSRPWVFAAFLRFTEDKEEHEF